MPLQAHAQVADSAALLMARASEVDSNGVRVRPFEAESLYLRAAAIFRARRDVPNEAEALFGAARVIRGAPEVRGNTFDLRVIPLLRQAVALFLSADSLARAADALEAMSTTIYTPRWTRDSVQQHRAHALALRRQVGDRVGAARILAQDSHYLSGFDDRIVTARRGVAAARAVPDTLAELLALNALGVAFIQGRSDTARALNVRRAYRDSAVTYFAQGARLARTAGNGREEFTDLFNIITLFQSTSVPALRIRDSALYYAHEQLAAARRNPTLRSEASVLSTIAALYQAYGAGDSAHACHHRNEIALIHRRELRSRDLFGHRGAAPVQ